MIDDGDPDDDDGDDDGDPVDDIEPVFYVRTWSGSIVPLRQGHRVLLGWMRHWWDNLSRYIGL